MNIFDAGDFESKWLTGGVQHAAGTLPLEALVAALDHPREDICWRAAVALGWRGEPQAVSALVARLDGARYEVKINIVWALGQIGDRQAIDPLLAVVREENHRDPDIAYMAALALLRFGALEALRHDLDSASETAYRVAHAALASAEHLEA